MLREAIGDAKGFALDQEDKRTRAETGVSRSAVYRYESVTSDVPGLGRTVRFEAGYRGSANAAVKRTIRSMVPEYAKHKGQQNLAEDLRDFRDRTVGPSTHVCREAVCHSRRIREGSCEQPDAALLRLVPAMRCRGNSVLRRDECVPSVHRGC